MCNPVDDEPEVFDARRYTADERHKKIFEIVGELDVGETFILINDRDPKPYRDELEAGHPHEFSWSYLENGAAQWKVQIGKVASAAA
jgi:uncharacterized protein (DUF2249 family)